MSRSRNLRRAHASDGGCAPVASGTMALRISLAGLVGIEHEGTAVKGTALGRLGRLALAYLTSERHRPITHAELAEVLWGDDLPGSWEQLVRGVDAKLRAAFRGTPHRCSGHL